MNLITTLMLAAALFGFGNGTPNWVRTYQRSIGSVREMLISVPDSTITGTCTVSVIGVGEHLVTALTAGHCIADEKTNIYTVDSRPAVVLFVDHGLDLAVLAFPVGEPVLRAFPLAVTIPPVGTPIAILGYAQHTSIPSLKAGMIALSHPNKPVWMTAPTLRGDSGGAIITQDGTLVGIVNGSIGDGGVGHVAYGVPIDVVHRVLAVLQ